MIIFAGDGWVRTYGGGGGCCVQLTDDGGYIIVGVNSEHLSILKTDGNGDTLWTSFFPEGIWSIGKSITETSDGCYIVTGLLHGSGINEVGLWLIKVDSVGKTLWSYVYGSEEGADGECVQKTNDGNYIITGIVKGDLWLLKANPQGDTIWTKRYGREGYEDIGLFLEQTKDGGFVITGYKDYSVALGSEPNLWLLRTNSQGDTLWTKNYGGLGICKGTCVRQTEDEGFIVTGINRSLNDLWLIKTNNAGNIVWSKIYDCGVNWDASPCIQKTIDGGYILITMTLAFGAGSVDFWLARTNIDGDTLWTRTYGGTGIDWPYYVQQTNDEGYILVGSGMGGLIVIKTDSLGDIAVAVSPTDIGRPDNGGDYYGVRPGAYFTNWGTFEEAKGFYCHCEIADINDSTLFYHDSVLIAAPIKPWETRYVSFVQWIAPAISSFTATFYTTKANNPQRKSVSFRWSGIAEPVTPVRYQASPEMEISSSIGSTITLRYSNCADGFRASVYDASGREIDEIESSSTSGTLEWGECYGPGMYFILAEGSNRSPTKVVLVR